MAEQDSDVVGIPRPGRIRAARDLRALTQKQVVDRMQQPVTTAALSQIESGRMRPSPTTLQNLAAALSVPTGFFLADWNASGTDDVLSHIPYFRDLAATPARERRRAGAMTVLLSDLINALENQVQLPALHLPDYRVPLNASRSDVESVAQALRGEWNLGEVAPVSNVVQVIERHGIPVARLRLPGDTVSAFSIRLERPLIVLGSNRSNYVRSRFDAAHELGHLVIHKGADANDRAIEAQAHQFASSLLLPDAVAEEVLPRRIDARGWSALAELKRDYGISMSAMLFRAREMQLLTPDRYRTAMKYMSSQGWRRSEPGDRQMGPAESPSMISGSLALLDARGCSTTDFISAANLPLRDTMALISQALDDRPKLLL